MNKLEITFNKRKVFLPVIHLMYRDQMLRNTVLAKEIGADGVFFIDHGVSDYLNLHQLRHDILNEVGDFWIGMNYLDLPTLKAMEWSALNPADGLWSDNAYIEEESSTQAKANTVKITQEIAIKDFLYFGGVAFKYQKPVKDFKKAAQIARSYVDVITTSGSGTGHAADIEKIKEMYEGAENHPLGIASGITPENVSEYLPYIDAFLVSTGISVDFHNLDKDKTKQLCETINSF